MLKIVVGGMDEEWQRITVQVPVHDEVKIDEDEMDALSLPPNLATQPKVDKTKSRTQQEIRDSKIRYGIMNQDYGQEGKQDTEEHQENKSPEEEILEEQHRLTMLM